ncbi:phage tail tape measure protein [Clostridium gasigenes]|uniref:phage tail tape measure protein n=1 Tax=Clostridium gasigenes TaxID=94869 RepID=UPI001C0B0F45|nr:phage tail tape measure protein [Clostridium gasigenes]MBU3107135.1 phage tail tape measure protein [Clostridium gasigenes]
MADGKIIIDTKVDTSGAEKGVGQLGSIASKGMKITAGAIAGVTAALSGMSLGAIKIGANFEEGMSKVKAISGATGDEIVSLTEKAKEMGAKTKFSASESAAAFMYMAQAGWKSSDMLSGIEGVMNLAAASGEDLAQVSSIVTDSLTAFGLKAKDSAHFADVLARASADSNTNVGLMGYTFKYVAPLAGALKYSIEDTAVAIGLMANSGIKGEQAGTSLRAMLTNLVNPTDTVAGAMKRLNISATNSNGSMKPLNQLLVEMRSSFSGLTDEQKASAASSIAGKEAMSGLLAIVNASDEDFNTLSKSIANSNGAAKEMATIMQDNLKGKVEQLGGALETVGLTAYEKFEGPMKGAIETAINAVDELAKNLSSGGLSDSVDKLAQGFADLITKLSELTVEWLPKIIEGFAWILEHASEITSGIVGIGTALMVLNVANMIMGVVGAFKKAQLATEGLTVAQWLLNIAMEANPVGIVIALVAGLIAGIIVLWSTNEDFRNAVIGAWEKIKEVASTVWGGICEIFNAVIDFIKNNWQGILLFLVNPFVGGFNLLYENCNGFKEFIDGFVQAVKDFFVNGFNSIVIFFTETIPKFIEDMKIWFNQLPVNLGIMLGEAIGNFFNWMYDVNNFFTVEIPKTIENIRKWFAEMPGKVKESFDKTINDIKAWGINLIFQISLDLARFIQTCEQWISQLPGRFKAWLDRTIQAIVTWGSNLYIEGKKNVTEFIDGIEREIKSLPQKFKDMASNSVKGFVQGFLDMKQWVNDKVGGFFGGIVTGVKNTLKIHSPSRVFRDEVGAMMAQGVGVGFEDETKHIQGDMQNNLSDLTAKMQATVNYETSKTSSKMTAGLESKNTSEKYKASSREETGSNKKTVIEVPVIIDGKEVARATAPYQDEFEKWNEGR